MFMGSIQNKAPDDISKIYIIRSFNLNSTPHKKFSGVEHLKTPKFRPVERGLWLSSSAGQPNV